MNLTGSITTVRGQGRVSEKLIWSEISIRLTQLKSTDIKRLQGTENEQAEGQKAYQWQKRVFKNSGRQALRDWSGAKL